MVEKPVSIEITHKLEYTRRAHTHILSHTDKSAHNTFAHALQMSLPSSDENANYELCAQHTLSINI